MQISAERLSVVVADAGPLIVLGIKVIGTLGVLVLAKRKGQLQEIHPLIAQMRSTGHHLSDAAVSAALNASGEA